MKDSMLKRADIPKDGFSTVVTAVGNYLIPH